MNAPVSMLRNTAWATLGKYVEYFLGMVMSILIARALGPEDYGVYAFAIWISHLALLAVNGGLPTALIKFLAELRGRGDSGSEGLLFRRVNRFHRFALGGLLALGGGVIALFGDAILPNRAPGELLWLVLLATAFKASYMFRQGLAKGREDFRSIALTILVVAPINTAAVAAATAAEAGLATFLTIFTGAGVAYLGLLQIFLRRLPAPDAGAVGRVEALRPRLHRHIVLATANSLLAFLVFKQSELLFLRLFSDSTAIGYFNIAFTLSTAAATLVPGILGSILLPAMARAVAQDEATAARTFRQSTRYLWLLGLPLAVGGAMYADNLVALLYGPDFRAAAVPLAFLLVATTIHMLSTAGSSYQISSDRQHILLRMNLVLVVVTLVLDWFLIRHFGLAGAVAAFTVTNIAAAVFILNLSRRQLRTSLPVGPALRAVGAVFPAALVAWPLHWLLPSAPELFIGGSLFVLVYVLASLPLGCWSAGDLATARRQLERRGVRRILPMGGALIDRVGARPAVAE
ncbi:oligosaccharide flippase family protein [Thiohalospira sp.]|uniref:oligosaccharide flippase family protein n=1 Tax=Thiohalospira sp. TaxID=3080549 RepID=UPI003980E04B